MTMSPRLSQPAHSHLSRRQLLQVGTVGYLGLDLGVLLGVQRAQADTSADILGRAKSCIFILQYGGASQIDSWDMKPTATEEIRGAFQPIQTTVPGFQICEKLPLLAERADRYAVVRSLTTSDGGHDGAMHICMTGHKVPTDQTPYFGSVVSKLAPTEHNLPSYVWVQNLAGDVRPWYLTGGALGMAHSPLRVGNDLENPAKPGFRFTAFDPPAEVTTDRQSQRFQLLRALDEPLQKAAGPQVFQQFQTRAQALLTGHTARHAFDVEQEPMAVRDRYGRHPLGQNLLLARRLVESGVRLVTVVAWTGVPEGEAFRNVQTWDMHGVLYPAGDTLFGNSSFGLGWALPRVDQGVSALLDDLEQRGLLDETLVVMVGEFGRTPRVNARGRDHWPNCYSAMLAGGGVRGGTVYGATDNQSASVKDNPVTPADFTATLFHALGIAPETRFGPDGFSLQASTGQPVLDLFG